MDKWLLVILDDLTIIDHALVHPHHGIDVEGCKAYRAVSEGRVEASGVARPEVSAPNGSGSGRVRWGSLDDDGRVEVRPGRKVPANYALVPTGVVPAFVVTAIVSESFVRKALLRSHDGVGRSIDDVAQAPLGSLSRPSDDALAAWHGAEVLWGAFVSAGAHAQRCWRNVAEILMQFTLVKTCVTGVIAARE